MSICARVFPFPLAVLTADWFHFIATVRKAQRRSARIVVFLRQFAQLPFQNSIASLILKMEYGNPRVIIIDKEWSIWLL
jgi:hypothetical protein